MREKTYFHNNRGLRYAGFPRYSVWASMKSKLERILSAAVGEKIEVEAQTREEFGHYTTSAAMRLGKERNKNPREVAEELKAGLLKHAPQNTIAKAEIAGPGFLNIWLTEDAIRKEFAGLAKNKNFGKSKDGKNKKVIVEYSQPNIAKQMHTGHLRNTILGEAIARIHEANSYKVVRWNWVGDWGTQFGKLIVAYKLWGKSTNLKREPIEALEALYVRFHEALKKDPSLEGRGREEFKKLEEGNKENRRLWKLFRDLSLKEIGGIYKLLKVKFDTYIGEAHFEKEMQPLVTELLRKNVAEISEGAVIVNLDKFGLPPALIRKSDGASLYLTRDIAGLRYRISKYKPQRFLYVVGNEQTLHFSQLIAIAGILGLAQGVEIKHVKYGLLLGAEGKKMSTRKGTAVSVRGLMDEAVERAKKIIKEKNREISAKERDKTAQAVGIGALKYFMLRENRLSDITFDWEKMLDFKGDSGPYLQYTCARLKRVLKKAGKAGKTNLKELKGEHELRLMRKMFQFPEEIRRSASEIMTNNLTAYLFEFANLANRFYEGEPILTDKNAGRKNARLMLADTAGRVLADGLNLLGIEAPAAI